MKKFPTKALSLILALVMLFALAACKKTTEDETPPDDTVTPTETPVQPTETPTPEPTKEPQTLVVGYSNFSQKFSPFFSKTAYDRDVADMTQIYLLINDRAGNVIMNGIKGETFNYNGTDYLYSNIADIEVVQRGGENDPVDYKITLRDDVVFSDGVKMTIDDVIFCIYVMCDPSYDGSYTFYSMPVTGMQNFRTGVSAEIYDKYEEIALALIDAGPENDDFSDWSEALQDVFWNQYFESAKAAFLQDIIDFCTGSYGGYLEAYGDSEIALTMAVWNFGDYDDDDVFTTFVTGTVFDLEGGELPTVDDFWDEILAAYGFDLEEIDDGEANDVSLIDLLVSAFISGEGPKDPAAGGEITNIAGVKKTGDYSCTITTDYFDATSIYQLGFQVSPMHYYGDKNLYDYNNDKFGFPKGDLTLVRSRTTEPMGAGPYKYISYSNGVVSFEANPNYYKGMPKIDYVRFQETADADKLTGIVSGTFDITDPSFSDDAVASIKNYNSNGELSGDKIVTSTVDNLGYGYIGLNANTIKVGDDPASKASKDLRAALATMYAVFRPTVVSSYYGDRASVIQYPISNTSWAAPRPNDPGYKAAYSIDVSGNSIYTDTMTEAQRSAAALEASIGFFKAAGYTFDEGAGKFTAAPAGASMTYEVIIPADGVGNHPAYGILTAVKEALSTIGITLEINDPTDSNILWTSLESGTAEMWCAAWQATIDPDMYQVYHGSNIVGKGGTDSNHYAIDDPELNGLILDARRSADNSFRKATYKRCLEIIMEWAVEVPNYQRQNAVVFSPERVNMSTVTPDITTFWTWLNDLELLETN